MNKITKLIVLAALLTGCRETIIHNISEHDSNRIVTKLQQTGIDAVKEKQPDGQWSVAVPSNESRQALVALETSRLTPKSKSDRSKSSMGASRDEQRFAFERGVSGEIEETLERIPGVLEARVHVSLPVVDPIFGTKLPQSSSGGSVLLVVESGVSVPSEEVARLVAGATGIEAAKISVLQSASAARAQTVEVSAPLPVATQPAPQVSAPEPSSFRWHGLIPVVGLIGLSGGLIGFSLFSRKGKAHAV